jgi:cytochrome b561
MTASKFVEPGRRAIWFDRVPASARATRRLIPSLGQAMLALSYATGLAGVLQDSWHGAHDRARFDFHILFGLLLWLTVLVRFAERKNKSCPMHAVDLRKFRRHLLRSVYLLLYVLFGVGQLIIAGSSLWTHGVWQSAVLDLAQPLREYLACGILAVLTIYLLAALEHRADHQHHE